MASRCCGFSALRCWLIILNVFYIAVSLFLIGLVIAARTLAYHFTSITIVIGIAVAAALLFIVAVIGLIGTLRHHQVVLFFYMVILGLCGILLFSVSVAALAIPKNLREDIFFRAWKSLSIERKENIQNSLNCCGFNDENSHSIQTKEGSCHNGHPFCNTSILLGKCCRNSNSTLIPNPAGETECEMENNECPDCSPCYTTWEKTATSGVLAAGAFGLIFSFTQIIGIVLTFYFRNQKDPSANPSAFL